MAGTIMHQSSDEADLTPEETPRTGLAPVPEVETVPPITSAGLADEGTGGRVGHGSSSRDQVTGTPATRTRSRAAAAYRRRSGRARSRCLNYALALSLVSWPHLSDVAASFEVILQRVAAELGVAGLSVSGRPTSRCKWAESLGQCAATWRRALIHHGTLLYDFDPRVATRYLTEPARQPAYRAARRHGDFMGNIPHRWARFNRGWKGCGKPSASSQALRAETRISASCKRERDTNRRPCRTAIWLTFVAITLLASISAPGRKRPIDTSSS